MSEMEYMMNSSWLPTGRKFRLEKLEKLVLKNVGFYSRNANITFELENLKHVHIGPYILRGRVEDLYVRLSMWDAVNIKIFRHPLKAYCLAQSIQFHSNFILMTKYLTYLKFSTYYRNRFALYA